MKKSTIDENDLLKKFCDNAFGSDFIWIPGLKEVKTDDMAIPKENCIVMIGRKWGESNTLPLSLFLKNSLNLHPQNKQYCRFSHPICEIKVIQNSQVWR